MITLATVAKGADPHRRPAVPSAVLGTLVFVGTEVMFFMALISAFVVIRSHVFGAWVPPLGIRLPVAATAFNTAVLITSGVLLVLACRSFARPGGRERARSLLSQALLLGAFFVLFQGYEWIKLIRYGMTMSSSIFGATFFLIIGSHGLHAFAAIIVMALLYRRLQKGRLTLDQLKAMQVLWLFVVGIWPLLYGLVYFG